MKYARNILLTSFILTFALCGFSYGDTWTLTNNDGGGYVQQDPTGFTLFGSDRGWENIWWLPWYGAIPNVVTYTFTAGASELLTYQWHYGTWDADGPCGDRAGYVLNGAGTQLSPYTHILYSCEDAYEHLGDGELTGGAYDGALTVQLNPGDTFGFYVYSEDSAGGPGLISVTGGNLPEPAPLSLLATGLLGLVVPRRRVM